MNDHREILFYIENYSREQQVVLDIPRLPCFFVQPSVINLETLGKTSFVITFMPNNVGNYNKDIEIKIQGGKYKLTLKASGSSSTMVGKRP